MQKNGPTDTFGTLYEFVFFLLLPLSFELFAFPVMSSDFRKQNRTMNFTINISPEIVKFNKTRLPSKSKRC